MVAVVWTFVLYVLRAHTLMEHIECAYMTQIAHERTKVENVAHMTYFSLQFKHHVMKKYPLVWCQK